METEDLEEVQVRQKNVCHTLRVSPRRASKMRAENRATDKNLRLLEKDFERIVPVQMGLEPGTEASRRIAAEIRQFYFGDKPVSRDTIASYLDIWSDVLFSVGMGRYARVLSRVSPHPTFSYYFTFDGRLAVVKRLVRGEVPGVSHGDELGYIFPVEGLHSEDIPPGATEFVVRDRWVRTVVNFAKYGNPTPNLAEDPDTILNVTWPATTPSSPRFMDLGAELRVREGYVGEDTYKFWEKLYRSVGKDEDIRLSSQEEEGRRQQTTSRETSP